jgi:dienelactone hydrolase
MIITLCGSTKFKKEFEEVAKNLALEGHAVLSVNMFHHADNLELTTE